MAKRNNVFILKNSNVTNKKPVAGQLLLGELGLNTADAILYTSGTTFGGILPIGWDRVMRTGDTMTGPLYVPTISATTYLNLPSSVNGSGTTNFVSKFTSPTTLGDSMIFDNGTNVGIGTTTPTAPLEVYGRISQQGLGRSTYLGFDAGKVDDLNSRANTGVGLQALRNVTSGEGNVGFGYRALYFTTTGYNNIGMGLSSLYDNTIGFNNIGIGFQTLFKNTTGSMNISLGSQVLKFNISGEANIGLGASSLFSNTTGSNNIGFGTLAGYTNTTGSDNVNIGNQAGRYNNVGLNNVTIGTNALWGNVSGSTNIGIGLYAGNYLVTPGLRNTNGNSSIFIGSNTKALGDNQTNQIVIGDSASGIGSNTVTLGNDAIITTALKGAVGIGTTTPTAPLEIYGRVSQQGLGGSTYFGYETGISDNGVSNINSVGFGYQVLRLSTGLLNVGVGYQALRNNTTGTSNTAVGTPSLSRNTTGDFNTAVGSGALNNSTTGGGNIALGAQTLATNSTGGNNTVIGRQAMYFNSTGSGNIALGQRSLVSNDTGNTNLGIGFEALASGRNISENIAIGHLSLQGLTGGTRNLALGLLAGRNLTDSNFNRTSTNSTFLGYSTKALGDNQTNQIVIGFEANGIGSNTVVLGNDSIITTALKGAVGIGTTIPTAPLEVYGRVSQQGLGGSTYFGFEAGKNDSGTTVKSNVAVGFAAMRNITTGSNNIGIGINALRNVGLGISNVGIGSNVLVQNSGANNIAMGSSAGTYFVASGSSTNPILFSTASIFIGVASSPQADNQTNQIVIGHTANGIGSNTVVLGNDAIITTALKGNVGIGTTAPTAPLEIYGRVSQQGLGGSTYFGYDTGIVDNGVGNTNSVGFGYQVLRLSTGLLNVGIGYNTLRNNTTGSNNTAVGPSSLGRNTTGEENVSVGSSAMYSNRISTKNTCIGTNSMYYITGGTSNVAIGNKALYSIWDGEYNIGIGVNAGMYGMNGGVQTSNTSPMSSIYIGNSTRALNINEKNQIVIGVGATGSGSNSVTLGNTSITKTQLRGEVLVDKSGISNQENLNVGFAFTLIASVSAIDYDSAFFNYVVKKDLNVRAGTITACHNGTNIEFTETTTNDLGNTSDIKFKVVLEGGFMRLYADSLSSGWKIKTLIKSI